ncbi:MAG: glycosyltransferase family 4 protein, partial [bacterium]
IYHNLKKIPLLVDLINKIQKQLFKENGKNLKEIYSYFYSQIFPDKLPDKSFVVDIEHANALFDFSNPSELQKQNCLKILANTKCLKLLPWSYAAVKTLKNIFGDDYYKFEKKVEVMYPALQNNYKLYLKFADSSIISKDNKKIKLLFVGKDYKRKGALELLDTFKILEKRFTNVELYLISNVPDFIKEKYISENVHFFPCNFSSEEIFRKFYLNVDLFVFPTHVDTFGMVLLEALSCGLPVVTTRQFACEEIITENQNGWFVESNVLPLNTFNISEISNDYLKQVPEKLLTDSLVVKLSDILEKGLLNNFNKEVCYKLFDGTEKFSIGKRNLILSKIYNE